MKFRFTLRARLTVLVLSAVIPVLGLSVMNAIQTNRETVAKATENLESSASLIATSQQHVADSVQQMLSAVALVPDLVQAIEPFCQRYFKNLTDELPTLTNVGVMGTDGYIRCQSLPNASLTFIGDRVNVKSAMTSGNFTASGYLISRVNGKAIITFGLPVKGGDGKPQALVFATMFLSDVAKALTSIARPAGERVVIMDRDGVVLAGSPENMASVGKPVSTAWVRDAIKAGVPSAFETADANGAMQIHAFRPSNRLPNPPFYVLVSADKSHILASGRQHMAFNLLALTLIGLVGSWLAWLLSGRPIVRIVAHVLDATNRIQAGEKDVRLRVRPGTAETEYSLFASGFNSMADAVQQRDQAQKKNYAELRQAQDRLVAAQKLGRIGYWERDLLNHRITLSDELHALFGLKQGEYDGTRDSFLKMLHPDDREFYEERRLATHHSGTNLEIEYRIITPAGDVRWIYQFGQLRVDEAGQPFSRAGLVQDITARKQSELQLLAITERLRRTSEMTMVGGWELLLDGMVLTCSDQQLKIHDLPPGTPLTAEAARDAYPPEARRTFVAAVRAAISHGTPWDLELPLVTSTGRSIWVRTQGRAIWQDGKVTGFEGALQDVTAQHDSREQLRLLESAVARLNDIVLITEAEPVDEPGPRIVYVNDAFEKHTGYSREEALGRSPRFLQGPNTQREELQRITQALKAWQPVRAELINYTKTGEEFWVEIEITPIANAKGWFTHWVSVQRDITQRKEAEMALMNSEQRYAALFEMAPVPMWVYDINDHRFLTVNRAAVETYGYSEDEFRSMTTLVLHNSVEPVVTDNKLLAMMTLGKCWEHRRKDGSLLQVNVVSKSIQYLGCEACFVVALDITAQVKAENSVQNQILALQRAAVAAQAVIWQQTVDEILQEVADQARFVINAHQCAISLTLVDELPQFINAISLSEKYTEYRNSRDLPSGFGPQAMFSDNNLVVRMTQSELEAHPRCLDFKSYADKYPATRGWLAVPLRGRRGQNIGLLHLSDKCEGEFTLQDEYLATELAQLASIAIENTRLLDQVYQLNVGLEQTIAERTQALTRQEALFRALAEQAPQVIWTADAEGHTNYFNRAWFDLVGGTPEEWAGRRLSTVIHPEDLPGLREQWKHAVATQSPFVGIRRLHSQDGSYHVMSFRASPVLDEQGEVSFWVGIDADITEIKNIESALRLSNQELEAFSYSVSHDLRSPLNTIDGFSRLLATQITADAGSKAKHYLTRIQAGVAQMGNLIEDLLSLSQVSRMELRHELIDLSDLSRRILDDWQTRDPHRHVESHIEPDLIAHGDARLIRVLMENLLGNAWKFTSQREHANISVGQQPDAAGTPVFFVRDDGAGFDMAYADKLYVAFQRLHLASEFPGSGVGLATVSRVIGRHGGQLKAESSPGNGATFFFTLPKLSVAA